VEALDWDPNTATCRGGLHGWLWGAGDLFLRQSSSDCVWLLVAVDESDISRQASGNTKVKFRRGEVLYAGTFSRAFRLMVEARCASEIAGLLPQRKSIDATGGLALSKNDRSAVSVGYYSQAMVLWSTQDAGHAVSVGDCSQAVADRYGASAVSLGNSAHAGVSQPRSTAVSVGQSSYAEATEHNSTVVACGKQAQAVVRMAHGLAFASGEKSEAVATALSSVAIVAGERGRATSQEAAGVAVSVGPHCAVESTGWKGLSVGLGAGAKAKAGEDGTIVISYQDPYSRRRLAVGYVGENGIKADTWYRVWDCFTGQLEEVPAAEIPT
jgi:hypothetical protein